MKKKIKMLLKKIICKLLSTKIFKINNKKIVFDNFNGKGFGCNPKYIALELIKENVDCKMVWLVNDINTEMPKQIKKVKYGSIKSYYELATAKVWIDNVRNSKGVKKKKGQFYIQTWHGSIGFKKVEAEVENLLSKEYVKCAKIDAKNTDLMISDSTFLTNVFKRSFWYDGTIEETGFPRDDILNTCPADIRKKVYDYYNIDYSKKIILYAPTFRKNTNLDVITFDYEKCCKIISEKFKEDFVFCIRLHPNDAKKTEVFLKNKNVINMTEYPDIQEIIAASDIEITDYSSIAFDMAKVSKPVFLFCKDYKEYMSKERDLLFDINKTIFPLSITEEELYDSINNFEILEYQKKCEEFFEREEIKYIKTNKASYNVVQIIKKYIK